MRNLARSIELDCALSCLQTTVQRIRKLVETVIKFISVNDRQATPEVRIFGELFDCLLQCRSDLCVLFASECGPEIKKTKYKFVGRQLIIRLIFQTSNHRTYKHSKVIG